MRDGMITLTQAKVTWIKAKDMLPPSSGYYLICALPGNWMEIKEEDALGYLKSRHGRRLAWFHDGTFWEINHPSRDNIASNYITVYWANLPDAPENPELDPLNDKHKHEMWSDDMRTNYKRVQWLTALARQWVNPEVLQGDPRKWSVAYIAKALFDALGITAEVKEESNE